jgi:hypothetical protein
MQERRREESRSNGLTIEEVRMYERRADLLRFAAPISDSPRSIRNRSIFFSIRKLSRLLRLTTSIEIESVLLTSRT